MQSACKYLAEKVIPKGCLGLLALLILIHSGLAHKGLLYAKIVIEHLILMIP